VSSWGGCTRIDNITLTGLLTNLQPNPCLEVSGRSRLTACRIDQKGNEIGWDADARHRYQIEWTPSLPSEVWFPVGRSYQGSGRYSEGIPFTHAQSPQGFFRVREFY